VSEARHIRFTVEAADAALRLDQLLAARIPGLSRRKARVLLEIGGVFVDRARVKVASRQLRAGQVVEATLGGALERASGEVGRAARARDAADLPAYRIVHQDDDLVVVDKPAGLLTAPTPEGDQHTVLTMLAASLGPIFLVHRIDLPTSGLLVFARTDAANRALAERFRVHDVGREYLAVVAGRWPADRATVAAPVQGKRAVTHVTVVEPLAHADAAATLIRCRLETGRTHQIRIHAEGAGHPVLGDPRYGRALLAAAAIPAPPRLALHAAHLSFVHPTSATAMGFDSPWPDDLAPWLDSLRG
jgi:23S rRNA pseudouridine1911/1915/1917 synthase